MQLEKMMNPEQLRAVKQIDGPLLILAGAGSGKTRVVTHRIAYMIEQGISPWNILAIAFTNKAAGEMRERVDDIVGFGAESIWISTFHSTCVRILRRHIEALGYQSNFTIYDTDDQKSTMKQICKKLNIDTKYLKERTILSAIAGCKNEIKGPESYYKESDGSYQSRQIYEAYKEYQATLKKNNALDFDDLLVKTVELFRQCPEVLESYQERFRYICVDEYQDTNTVQFEMIRLLAGKYRNLCVVGDDDQSIYKFRGANIRNILDFEKNYPDATVIKLEQNYRSTGNILNAANAVISHNAGRKGKALWTEKGDGRKLHFRQFDNAFEEAEFVAYDIARKVRSRETNFKDCAVLYRTNAQSRTLEEQFVRDNISYRLVGGVNFYGRKEIKDVLAYLKVIDSGLDDLMVKRIINIPKRGIGATSIEKVQRFADEEGISFFEALTRAEEIPTLGKTAQKLKGFSDMIRVFRTKIKADFYEDLPELIDDVLAESGYLDEWRNSDEEDAKERIENIDELITKAAAFEEKFAAEHEHEDEERKPTLEEFLTEVSLVADIDSVDNENDRVLLMTIHSAKGLEFKHVYMVGMEDGLFPSYMTIVSDDPSDMEEERRLAYVGITRAMEDLTLTYAKSRMIRGETQYNPVSRFVREIPPELMDNTVPTVKRRDEDVFDFRPKAVLKPKITPQPVKPFIAQGIGSLNRVAGINKGAAALETDTVLDYEKGDRVRHVKYGEGTVINIEREPRDYKVTVNFDNAGQKIMYASFAKLKRV